MKTHTFEFQLAEYKEYLKSFDEYNAEDITLTVQYHVSKGSVWLEKVVVKDDGNVRCEGINILSIIQALGAEPVIKRIAEEKHLFHTQESIAKNYSNIHRNAMAYAYERKEWQRIK
jgi:lysozyme family protein